MGLLVNGQWADQWYETESSKGQFIRQDSVFRHWVTATGEAGQTGEGGFKAEKGRYHLYVSLACPWAHRTLIFRAIKELEDYIDVTVVEPLMLEQGWAFANGGEPVYGYEFLHQLYSHVQADITTRVTVPVLWDKQRQTIVSNESSEIIRMLNGAFNHLTNNDEDYYPEAKRAEIDAWNEAIYASVNNGVYRAGFATTQQAYEAAYIELFAMLDRLDDHLAINRYLLGESITEADWRLFTTLVRFDAVYFGHFKTNQQRIADYPSLSAYVRELYQQSGVTATVDIAHIKQHYYGSHPTINPTGIVPLGQEHDFMLPHFREQVGQSLTAVLGG
ncbi:MAG: putative glutathione S-transferase [Pseudohongiellaceae bacterium]|jgi:putative glutathione S-transferase